MARNDLLLSPSGREAASLISVSTDEVRVQREMLFPALGFSVEGGIGAAGRGDPALELTGRQLLFDFGDTNAPSPPPIPISRSVDRHRFDPL